VVINQLVVNKCSEKFVSYLFKNGFYVKKKLTKVIYILSAAINQWCCWFTSHGVVLAKVGIFGLNTI